MADSQDTSDAGVGGRGEIVETDPHHRRASMRVLQQAVERGWKMPEGVFESVPATVQRILDDPDASSRDRLRAADLLRSIQRDRVEAAEKLDKVERLDAGEATDIVQLQAEAEERRRMMADPEYRETAIALGRREAALRRGDAPDSLPSVPAVIEETASTDAPEAVDGPES